MTALVAGVISAALIGAVTLVVSLHEGSVRDDIEKTNGEIDKCNAVIAENQKLHDYLVTVNDYQTQVNVAKNNLYSIPVVKEGIFKEIENHIGSGDSEGAKANSYTGFSYSKNDGTVTITEVELKEQQTANDFIQSIKDDDYFADVTYSGYTGTGEAGSPVVISSVTMYLKPIEVEDDTQAVSGEVAE